MNQLKLFRLGFSVVIILLAFGASASANPLTSPEGTPYTSTLKAESEGAVKLDGSFATVECKKSGLEGKVEAHAATSASGKLSSLTFGECNYPVTVLKSGSLEILGNGGGNGTVISSGAELKIETSVGECIFSTNNVDIGTLTGSKSTNATLDIPSAGIPRTGGNFLCGASGTFTGNYKVTTPSTLYVDEPLSPLTSPDGTSYTSTIKAESTNFKLHGTFVTVECSSSALEGKVESHTSTSAEGNLNSLAFSGCNYPVTVLKQGSLKIHAGESNSGTVTSSGAEISINTSVGTCIFTTSNTDIGTITDTAVTGTNAVLDLSGSLPRTGGNFLCGSTATNSLTGSFKVTTPGTLYVHGTPPPPPSPLTSPKGSYYTGTIKAESEGATSLHSSAPSLPTVSCEGSSAEGKVEAHSSSTASGKLSSLTFTGCNWPVTVNAAGSLEIQAAGGGNGTVTSSGAKITIETTVGACVYTTSNTDIGTLTGSSTTSGNATLDLNGAKIPRTAGNFLCGSYGVWTGSYKVTTPSTLYID